MCQEAMIFGADAVSCSYEQLEWMWVFEWTLVMERTWAVNAGTVVALGSFWPLLCYFWLLLPILATFGHLFAALANFRHFGTPMSYPLAVSPHPRIPASSHPLE